MCLAGERICDFAVNVRLRVLHLGPNSMKDYAAEIDPSGSSRNSALPLAQLSLRNLDFAHPPGPRRACRRYRLTVQYVIGVLFPTSLAITCRFPLEAERKNRMGGLRTLFRARCKT